MIFISLRIYIYVYIYIPGPPNNQQKVSLVSRSFCSKLVKLPCCHVFPRPPHMLWEVASSATCCAKLSTFLILEWRYPAEIKIFVKSILMGLELVLPFLFRLFTEMYSEHESNPGGRTQNCPSVRLDLGKL